jgi:hypothetical protein
MPIAISGAVRSLLFIEEDFQSLRSGSGSSLPLIEIAYQITMTWLRQEPPGTDQNNPDNEKTTIYPFSSISPKPIIYLNFTIIHPKQLTSLSTGILYRSER